MTSSPAPEEAIRECPWCGAREAKLDSNETKQDYPDTWFMRCECGARGPEQWNGASIVWGDTTPPLRTDDECKTAAIAAWNRRAGGEREYACEEMREACQNNYNAGRAAGGEREQQLEAAQGNSAWELLEAVMDSQITAREDDGVTLGLIQDALDAAYQRGARAALAGETEGERNGG